MDISQIVHILNYNNECKRVDRIIRKLEMADAFNHAYVGSQPPQKHKANKGARDYNAWVKRHLRDAFPEWKPTHTVWDRLPKIKKGKKRKLGV